MKWFAVAFAVAFSTLFPQPGICSKSMLQSTSWEEQEFAKRQPILRQKLELLKKYRRKAGAHGFEQVIELVEAEPTIVAPSKRDSKKSYSSDVGSFQGSIEILPLLKEDSEINETWKKRWEITNGAKTAYSLNGDPRVMLKSLEDFPINEPWGSIGFFHEMTIAIVFQQNDPKIDINNDVAWREKQAEAEDSAWESITQALLASEGEYYQALVEEEKNRLHSEGILSHPPARLHSKTLDLLFGNPLSSFEDNLRETALWIGAAIQIIEKNNSDPHRARTERIKFFHKALRNGYLQ